MAVEDRVPPGAHGGGAGVELGPAVGARLGVAVRALGTRLPVEGVAGERDQHVQLTHYLSERVKRADVLANLGQQLLNDPVRIFRIPALVKPSYCIRLT